MTDAGIKSKVSNVDTGFTLVNRLALRPAEAAKALGLSERAFREHVLPRCPKFYAGKAVLIPKHLFQKHIESLATEETQQTGETAVELLARTEQRSR